MARESFWTAVWRTNRLLPILIGVLVLCNLAALGLLQMVVGPRLESLDREFFNLQKSYREARRAEEGPRTIQNDYRRNLHDLDLFRAAIPEKSQLTGLIAELFSMAGNAGLTIDRIDYNPKPVEAEDLLSYSLTFNVSGDYGQIKKFIFLIEHSTRLIAIEQLGLNAPREAATKNISLRLGLTTYFRTGKS